MAVLATLTLDTFSSTSLDDFSGLLLDVNHGWSRISLDDFGSLSLDDFGGLELGVSPPKPPLHIELVESSTELLSDQPTLIDPFGKVRINFVEVHA